MAKVGIFYGSTLGDTKTGAELLAGQFETAEIFDVSSVSNEKFDSFDLLIFGSSTWGIGDLQDDWLTFIKELETYDFKNKKVAIFGFGDQESYPDSFVDAIGEIYEIVIKNEGKVLGSVSIESYEFFASKAAKNGKFVGLPLDEINQSNLTVKRIKEWTDKLKEQLA